MNVESIIYSQQILEYLKSSSWRNLLKFQQANDSNLEEITFNYELLQNIFSNVNDTFSSPTLKSLKTEFMEAEKDDWNRNFLQQINFENHKDLMYLSLQLLDDEFLNKLPWILPTSQTDQSKLRQILRYLSWTAPELYADLINSRLHLDQTKIVIDFFEVIPRLALITKVSYPFGGGQASFQELAIFANILGINVVWVSLGTPTAPHETTILSKNKYYQSMCIPYLNQESFTNFVKKNNPSAFITEGEINTLIDSLNQNTRIPVHRIFHYWNGLIKNNGLGTGPIQEILNKLELDDSFEIGRNEDYFVSQFMKNVYLALGGKRDIPILTPAIIGEKVESRDMKGELIQVNLHPNKGGDLFASLSLENPEERFLGVNNDQSGNNLILFSEIQERNNVRIVEWEERIKLFDQKKALLFPSRLHETFGRVALEAIQSGIPVFALNNGNLPLLLGSSNTFSETNFVSEVSKYLEDDSNLEQLLARQADSVSKYLENTDTGFYLGFIKSVTSKLSSRNIGIFTAWAEQGLGNQSHYYTKLLRQAGFKVHIFAYKPYENILASNSLSNTADWSAPTHCDTLVNSKNNREEVEFQEVLDFVEKENIGILLVPEVCWPQNWNRLSKLQRINNLNIKVIPNSETIVESEIENHRPLDAILCPTRQSQDIFTSRGFENVEYIGHGIGESREVKLEENLEAENSGPGIKYLHVAGHNPLTRKNTDKVIKAFIEARKERNDINLLVTSTKPVESFWKDKIPEGVEIISGTLTRDEISSLYKTADVSIQVSSHEGIGLGFYESIAAGVPVIALDAQPNNEVVLNGQTGWLIDCTPIPLPDNSQGLVHANEFAISDLTSVLLKLNKGDIEQIVKELTKVHLDRFSRISFQLNLIKSMKHGHQSTSAVQKRRNRSDIARLTAYVIIRPLWRFFNFLNSRIQKIKSNFFLVVTLKGFFAGTRDKALIRYGHLGVANRNFSLASRSEKITYLVKAIKNWFKNGE